MPGEVVVVHCTKQRQHKKNHSSDVFETLQVFSRLPLLLQACVTIFVGLAASLYFGWALALVLLLFAPLTIG